MGSIESLLAVSAKLYEHLSEVPDGEARDAYIEQINALLDERGQLVDELKKQGDDVLKGHQLMPHLIELDRGIRDRLQKVIVIVKKDMKVLQKSKKSEQQYLNPYSDVRVMDGMYYDGKK